MNHYNYYSLLLILIPIISLFSPNCRSSTQTSTLLIWSRLYFHFICWYWWPGIHFRLILPRPVLWVPKFSFPLLFPTLISASVLCSGYRIISISISGFLLTILWVRLFVSILTDPVSLILLLLPELVSVSISIPLILLSWLSFLF